MATPVYTDISLGTIEYLINNTDKDINFIQLLKLSDTINSVFMEDIDLYNQYTYKKPINPLIIQNTEIFNTFNTQNINTPICLIYLKGYNTTILNTDAFLPITDSVTFNDFLNYLQLRLKSIPIINNTILVNYLKYTIYQLTFIQLSYSNSVKTVNTNIDISNTITNVLTEYNYTYEYLDISNQSIFDNYSDSNNPVLLLIFQNISNNINNNNIIDITQNTNQLTIKNFMKSSLPLPTNSITLEKLNLYIQYSSYDLIFIKVLTPIIKNVNINTIMNAYINNKNIQYIDICNQTLYDNITSYGGDDTFKPPFPLLLLCIKDYSPLIKNYNSIYFDYNYTNILYLYYTGLDSFQIDTFLQDRLRNTIHEENTLQLYFKYTSYDLNFIQLTKENINKNNDISNNILTNIRFTYNYTYIDISNESFYSYYDITPTQNKPILLLFIKEYYNLLDNNIKSIYIDTTYDNYRELFSNLIQGYITYDNNITNVVTLNNYIKYTNYENTYLQVRKNTLLNINVYDIISYYYSLFPMQISYEYIDISNTEIYNYYNTTVNNILVLYKIYDNVNRHYIKLDNNVSYINISVLDSRFNNQILTFNDLINSYDLALNDITFLQVIKPNINVNIEVLNNLIELTFINKQVYYIDINSEEIYNKYNNTNNNLPILLVNIKGAHNILLVYNSYITLDSTFNKFTIYNYIQSKLNTTITTMNELFIYLKYTTYDITFIRLVNLKPIISTNYIRSLLQEYNINNIKYELIEIKSTEIFTFYKPYVRSIPSLLLFKNIYFTEDRYWQPCKFLSGENTIFANIATNINNSYLDKSLGQLQIFLKSGLK